MGSLISVLDSRKKYEDSMGFYKCVFTSVPNKFAANMTRQWIDNGLLRVEGLCVFSVEQSTEPLMINIMVDFTTPVERFEVCRETRQDKTVKRTCHIFLNRSCLPLLTLASCRRFVSNCSV